MTHPVTLADARPIEVFRAWRQTDTLEVARAIAREAFLADPGLQSIRFDFEDDDGVPILWLDRGAQDEGPLTLGDYLAPDGFPDDLEAIAQELRAEFLHEGCVAIERQEVLPDLDQVAEWVGLHYRANFDAEPPERRDEWVRRYLEAHRDAS